MWCRSWIDFVHEVALTRVGLIADVHGNAHALEAVLRSMRETGVDQVLFAGDFVGYYYEPARCFDLLAAWRLTAAVRGNHEDMLAARLNSPLLAADLIVQFGHGLEAAVTELSPKQHEWLASLPVTARVKIDSTRILLCHGAPWSTNEYVYPEAAADIFMRCAESGDDVIVLGHTHCPGVWRVANSCIINPGSVGQPRRGTLGAEWALLDLDTGAVTQHAVPYDVTPVTMRARVTDPHHQFLWQILERV